MCDAEDELEQVERELEELRKQLGLNGGVNDIDRDFVLRMLRSLLIRDPDPAQLRRELATAHHLSIYAEGVIDAMKVMQESECYQ